MAPTTRAPRGPDDTPPIARFVIGHEARHVVLPVEAVAHCATQQGTSPFVEPVTNCNGLAPFSVGHSPQRNHNRGRDGHPNHRRHQELIDERVHGAAPQSGSVSSPLRGPYFSHRSRAVMPFGSFFSTCSHVAMCRLSHRDDEKNERRDFAMADIHGWRAA